MQMNEFDMQRCGHDDVRHGFAIYFPETKPDFDIEQIEAKVNEIISQNLPVTYVDDTHIRIGDYLQECTGPRIHVHHTGQIENFHLLPHFIYDRFKRRYYVIGCVGEGAEAILEQLDREQQRPGWK